jgi:hypothetical protein
MPCASINFDLSGPVKIKKTRGFHKNQAVNLQTNVMQAVKRFYKIIALVVFILPAEHVAAQPMTSLSLDAVLFMPVKIPEMFVYASTKKFPSAAFHIVNKIPMTEELFLFQYKPLAQ